MRIPFLSALVVTIIIGATYWYQSKTAICPVPVAYRLGQLDEEFNLTPDQAKDFLLQAEAAWEKSTNRELFMYDDTATLLVNFVFDERQATADSEYMQRKALDEQQKENNQVFEAIKDLTLKYEALTAEYKTRTEAYERRLTAHNEKVQRYNDQGGAPQTEFTQLQSEERALNREAADLQTRSTELNKVANELNELSDRGNQLIETYNQEVSRYNEQFGYGGEFTQGDFQGDRINVYKFSDEAELVTVLAHELGHALGLGHVEGESSIMYYLLEVTSSTPRPSDNDMKAYLAVCETKGTLEEFIFNHIKNTLQIFN